MNLVRPRIAIIGAGIGGTTAAVCLGKAGFDVKIYEQAPAFARIGAGINLTPNMMRLMAAIGVADRMVEVGLIPLRRVSRDWDTGAISYEIPVQTFPERYGAPLLLMHRGDLQEILCAAVAQGIIQFGKRLAGLAETGSALKLEFSDGSSAEADIVIGADGINSKVREILLGPESPSYSGYVAYRAIFSTERLKDIEIPDLVKWWGEDRHILTYYLTRTRDEIYFVTGVPMDWDSKEFGPSTADPAEMRAAFRGFHPDVLRVLEACPQAGKWPILERKPFPLWSRGRLVLIGDACHPMQPNLGQGAAMAAEDAVVLARAIIAVNGEDHATAFRVYEATRFARTERVQTESGRNAWMRYPMDGSWLYKYDAWSTPLAAAPSAPAASDRPVPAQ